MEIRQFAQRVLESESLEVKLQPPSDQFTDASPGEPIRITEPARPANLKFAPRRTAPAMPKPGAFGDPKKRAVAHHIMANHELQALEVMALVLCAYPEAPNTFRLGLMSVLQDEQRHTRMHMDRVVDLGMEFGELPVNSYIWKKALSFEGIMDFVAGMSLTFEGRNLDHTLEFEDFFRHAGDERSARIMRAIHRDEIKHVRFGLEWLRKLKSPDQSDWDAYQSHLHWPLRAEKAVGDKFHRAPRLAAGMTDDFIDKFEESRESNIEQ